MSNLKVKTIEIKTESIKLDSFLKFIGVVSTGGEAKEIIKSEKVLVNENVCLCRGKKLVPSDVVCINGTSFYEVRNCENS